MLPVIRICITIWCRRSCSWNSRVFAKQSFFIRYIWTRRLWQGFGSISPPLCQGSRSGFTTVPRPQSWRIIRRPQRAGDSWCGCLDIHCWGSRPVTPRCRTGTGCLIWTRTVVWVWWSDTVFRCGRRGSSIILVDS